MRQLQLAEWFGVPQPDLSRWLKYWQAADWANLLSLHSAEVLTAELVGRIVEVCATFPMWGVARVYQHLRQQGVAVTEPQVQQAVAQSGWRRLQQTLCARYDLSGPAWPCARAGWSSSCWRKSGSCSGAWKRANHCRAKCGPRWPT